MRVSWPMSVSRKRNERPILLPFGNYEQIEHNYLTRFMLHSIPLPEPIPLAPLLHKLRTDRASAERDRTYNRYEFNSLCIENGGEIFRNSGVDIAFV